jgi:hypothetical protein
VEPFGEPEELPELLADQDQVLVLHPVTPLLA